MYEEASKVLPGEEEEIGLHWGTPNPDAGRSCQLHTQNPGRPEL